MRRKEIIVCILALIILGISITNVFASEQTVIGLNSMNNNTITLNSILESSNTTTIETNSISNTQNSIQSTNSVNTINSTNNTQNNSSPNQLANTGLEETSFIAIAICVLSAVFAYSRIKKYNF